MIVEIGAVAALFPEKEYISGIFVAVYSQLLQSLIFLSVGRQLQLCWRGENQPVPGRHCGF